MNKKINFGLNTLISFHNFLYNISDNASAVDIIKSFAPCSTEEDIITQFKEACSANISNINTLEDLYVLFRSEDFLLEIQELYSIGTGMLNIQPKEVLSMTPREIELAYRGFLKKTELQLKCLQTVFKQAKSGSFQPIKLLDSDIQQSTQEKRVETFATLGI